MTTPGRFRVGEVVVHSGHMVTLGVVKVVEVLGERSYKSRTGILRLSATVRVEKGDGTKTVVKEENLSKVTEMKMWKYERLFASKKLWWIVPERWVGEVEEAWNKERREGQ